MKPLKSNRLIKIFLIIYGILYTGSLVEPIFYSGHWSPRLSGFEAGSIIACFLLYIVGISLVWVNKKHAALVLMLQHLCVWIFFIAIRPTRDSGPDIVAMALPVLIMAAFLYRNWYVEHHEKYQINPQARLLMLDVLLLNYAVIYFFYAGVAVLMKLTQLSLFQHGLTRAFYDNLDFLSSSGIVLLTAAVTYLLGLVFLQRNRLFAGITFVLWYSFVVLLTFTDRGFSQTGPWIVLCIVVLVNGIIYIKDAYLYRQDLMT